MDALAAMTGSNPIAGMAAAVGVSAQNTDAQAGAKLFKDNESASLAVATLASSLPDNPNLGRNVNVTA